MKRLKIIALEPTDVSIIAAHLQDAVAAISDLTFSNRDRRLVMMVNRFAWEDAGSGTAAKGQRRRAALRIDRIERARTQGIDLAATGTVLSLLTVEIETTPETAPAGRLTLVFAGAAAIRLDVECVEIMLEDLGPAWQAQSKPDHSAASSPAPIQPSRKSPDKD